MANIFKTVELIISVCIISSFVIGTIEHIVFALTLHNLTEYKKIILFWTQKWKGVNLK